MNIPFATQSYKSKSLPLSAQQLVNFYAEKEPPDAKSPVAVFGSPGLTNLFSVGTGPIRGVHVMNDVLYVVSGNGLYAVNNQYSSTMLGGGIGGVDVVSMDDNGFQVAIANGLAGYVWDTVANTFTNLLTANPTTFYPADVVVYLDGYFIWNRSGTNQFFFSQPDAGTSYPGLNYDSAVVQSAFILAVAVQQENLLLFTQRTVETWYDAGVNNAPFARFNGATVERGCGAAYSICKEDNSIFYLGNDRIFYRLNVPQPIRVSQPAVEQEWQTYEKIHDAFTFNVNFEGHKFLFVTFPTANRTWCYDISTSLWHERISYLANGESLGRWRGNCSAVFNNITLVGDAFGNQIGQLSSDSFVEYGSQIIGTTVPPVIHSDRKRMFHYTLELDMETGVGIASGQGSDPQVMLDWSDDGGRTWKGPQRWASLGKIGEYQQRVRWTRLGSSRARIYRLQISDPVRRTIIAARGDIDIGDT